MSLFEALQGPAYVLTTQVRLTEEDVADIRKLYRECGWKQQEIADQFGISQPQVSKIVNNLQWKEESP